ncbi:MAG: 1-acyl-sn-glycerol-3-phosphate acyltransferase [Sphaerochaetaceae bacterium]|nr:1-acyl-sn-glycerol-3-phosphate acyltransferase [Sphaerochaetaceae bacterium]
MKEEFREMAPYEGKDFEEAIERLRLYPQFLYNFTDIISRKNRFRNKISSYTDKHKLAELLTQVHSYDDFQKKITCDMFLALIESTSIDELTWGGMENLEDDKAYIFVSNHRDIVLDAALLDMALFKAGKVLGEMVIGDNLIVNQFAKDLFKVNGAITVRRTLPSASELRAETLRMSDYLHYCVNEKKKSVWIAQKSGRSKDGIDNTSPAILKMIYLKSREEGLSFGQFLDRVKVVPVAISYQYDPCDVTKSHEEIRKLKAEGVYNVYHKKKFEDILDLVRGLRLYKGNVHIQIGKPLDSSFDNVKDATREIDRQIHNDYKLWDVNYFAYDTVMGTKDYVSQYKNMDTKAFKKHYSKFKPEVVDHVYKGYANPVSSFLMERELEKSEN